MISIIINKVKLIFTFSILTYFLQFILQITIAKIYGPIGTGQMSLLNGILSLVYAFTNFGFSNSLIHHNSISQNETKYYSIGMILSFIIGSITAILMYYNFNYLTKFIYNEVNLSTNSKLLFSITYPLYLFNVFISSISLSNKKIFEYNLFKYLPPLISIIFLITSNLFLHSVNNILISFFISNFILTLILYTINIKKLKFIFKNIFATIRNLFKYSISGYAGDLLNFFSYRGDIFILAYFTNIAAVGYYTLAVSFAELIFILPNSIALILFPHYSKIENRTNSQLAVIFSKFSFYVLIFFCIFLVIFSNIFIQIFFGTRYSESIQLMIIILPGIYFMSINKIYSSYFMGIGKPKIPMFISLVTIILTLTFDFILIPIFGAKGAAYSSDIGYIISFIISTMVFINNSGIKFSELFLVKKSDINNLKNALSFK